MIGAPVLLAAALACGPPPIGHASSMSPRVQRAGDWNGGPQSPRLPMHEDGHPAGLRPAVHAGSAHYGTCPPPTPRRRGLFGRWKDRRNARSEIGPPYHYDGVFNPPPLGASVNATMDRQVKNGEASLLVLHRMDFRPGTADLNAAGLRRLAWMAGKLPATPLPVLVEPTPDAPGLAAARRAAVLDLLNAGRFPVPDARVVVAPEPGTGLDGPDAELVYRNLLILTGSGGKLRTRFDVFGGAAQGTPTSPTVPGSGAAGTGR